ncbi:MAG: hypothetical protein AAF622_10115 [Cyanobacteria bacterium P01_C01_bin.147]
MLFKRNSLSRSAIAGVLPTVGAESSDKALERLQQPTYQLADAVLSSLSESPAADFEDAADENGYYSVAAKTGAQSLSRDLAAEDEATVAIAPQTAPTQGFNLGTVNLFDNEYSSTQKFVMLEPRPMIRG